MAKDTKSAWRCAAALAAWLAVAACACMAGTYAEDFSSAVHKDTTNTTAWWDTVAGEIKLYPANPVLKGTCQTENWPRGIVISGDYAYVCDGDFIVVDVSDPASPVTVATCTTECYTGDIDVEGNYAYVTDYSGGQACTGIAVIDVADPRHPAVVGSRNIAWGCMLSGICVSGHYVYVSAYDYDFEIGLLVFDVSDPSNPQFLGSVSAGGWYYTDVDVRGDYVYVTDWFYGVKVMDIADPAAPVLVDSCFASQASAIEVSGGYAYVARGAQDFQVIDLEDPAHPIPAGWTSVPGYPYDVAVLGDRAYLANRPVGLQVIDVADPDEPRLVGTCNTPGEEQAVAASGSYAYVSADTGGAFGAIRACAPNPFSSQTRVRFALPESGVVRVTVHDAAGRRVACLADGYRDLGEQWVTWNGCDDAGRVASPGIYFIRITAAGRTGLEKAVLLP